MARNVSGDPESPARHRRSPRRRSPSRRERSPLVKRSSHKDSSLEKERGIRHPKSPKRGSPPVSRSPSPRTKRLRRAEAEKGAEVLKDDDYEKRRGREKSNGGEREREVEKRRDKRREREMEREKEIVSNREVGNDRRDRRSSRDEIDERHSRVREREMPSSPSNRSRRGRHRSSSPQRVSGSRRDEGINSREDDERDDEDDSVAKMKAAADALEAKQKAQPSFELSGKLAEETNRFRGVTLLFNEPPDARKPDIRWRLYVFKAGDVMDEPLYIHRQTCYLFGRERRVADIPTDHPSCSKQHAVIQFRQVEKEQPDGTMLKQVRPYIMDLGSTNKTFLNNNPVEPQRYYELFEKDTIKFGNSSREYVLLHENSAGV